MNRIFLHLARFDFAVCQHFYHLTGSVLWLDKRELAREDISKIELSILTEAING